MGVRAPCKIHGVGHSLAETVSQGTGSHKESFTQVDGIPLKYVWDCCPFASMSALEAAAFDPSMHKARHAMPSRFQTMIGRRNQEGTPAASCAAACMA